MKKWLLSALFLGASAMAGAGTFQIFNQPNKVFEGRCHMGSCSYGKTISTKILQKSDQQVILKVKLLGGSWETDDYNKKPKIQWDKKPHELVITCSKTAPSITVGKQTTYLPFDPQNGVAGVFESDANTYFQYCHSTDNYMNGIRKFRYNTKHLE